MTTPAPLKNKVKHLKFGNIEVFRFDKEDVAEAVAGLKKDLCDCNLIKPIICINCRKIKKWLPDVVEEQDG